MNNKQVLEVAMHQSAIDENCNVDDFLKNENVDLALIQVLVNI